MSSYDTAIIIVKADLKLWRKRLKEAKKNKDMWNTNAIEHNIERCRIVLESLKSGLKQEQKLKEMKR